MAWMAVVDLITDGKKKELNAFYVDEFIYKNNKYRFDFTGDLLIFFNAQKVLEAATEYNERLWAFEVIDLKGFIDGAWIAELKEIQALAAPSVEKFQENIRAAAQEKARGELIDSMSEEQIRNLKMNFGFDE